VFMQFYHIRLTAALGTCMNFSGQVWLHGVTTETELQ